MLKRLLNKLKSVFSPKRERSKPTVSYGDMVGNVKIEKPYQLDKHTPFQPGESYKVGEMIVTVHASKESMLKAIRAVDARREAKHKKLTEKAVDIMLMTPEQLKQFQLDRWLSQRGIKHRIIQGIVGAFSNKRYSPPLGAQPSGSPSSRFDTLVKDVRSVDKVGK